MADALLRDSYMLTQHDGPGTAAELLGIDAAAIHKAVSDLPDGSDNRALVITLGLVLGCLEARCGKLEEDYRAVAAARDQARIRRRHTGRLLYAREIALLVSVRDWCHGDLVAVGG